VIPLGGFAAKLSIASKTPTEHRAKASKTRGIKNPDAGAEISFITLFHWRFRTAESPDDAITGDISRHVSSRGGFVFRSALALFEIALVLVRFDHGSLIHRIRESRRCVGITSLFLEP
jgi:hypothetical protein